MVSKGEVLRFIEVIDLPMVEEAFLKYDSLEDERNTPLGLYLAPRGYCIKRMPSGKRYKGRLLLAILWKIRYGQILNRSEAVNGVTDKALRSRMDYLKLEIVDT